MTVIDPGSLFSGLQMGNPGSRWQASSEAAWLQAWQAADAQGYARHALGDLSPQVLTSRSSIETPAQDAPAQRCDSPQATQEWLNARVSQPLPQGAMAPGAEVQTPVATQPNAAKSEAAKGALSLAALLPLPGSAARAATTESMQPAARLNAEPQGAAPKTIVLPAASLLQVVVNQGLVRVNVRDASLDELTAQQTLQRIELDLAEAGHAQWQVHLNGKQYQSTPRRSHSKE